jgi:hypothetical protein
MYLKKEGLNFAKTYLDKAVVEFKDQLPVVLPPKVFATHILIIVISTLVFSLIFSFIFRRK